MKTDVRQQKIAERLVILNDRGTGLLTRLNFYSKRLENKETSLKCLQEKNLESIIKTTNKKWPNLDPKALSNSYLQQNAAAIREELFIYIELFAELLEFRDKVIELFDNSEFLALRLSLTRNLDLTKGFLDICSTFVSILVLLDQVHDRKSIIGLYVGATGTIDSSLTRVTNSLIHKYSFPFTNAINEFKRHAGQLKSCLHEVYGCLNERDKSSEDWFQGDPFLCVATGDDKKIWRSSQLETASESLDLIPMERLQHWIVMVTLLMPELLPPPSQPEPWGRIVQQNLVLAVFRDFSIPTSYYTSIFYENNKTEMKRYTDIRNWHQNALSERLRLWEFHTKRRQYLRCACKELVYTLTDQPALISLKIVDVFKALSLARDEICWYLRHRIFVLDFEDKKKAGGASGGGSNKLAANDYYERLLPEMFGHLLDLIHLVLKYSVVIQKYFVVYLVDVDLPQLDRLLPTLGSSIPQEETEIFSSVVRRLYELRDRSADDLVGDDFSLQDIRLDWFRVQTYTSSANFSELKLMDGPTALVRCMNDVAFHSRFVDQCRQFLDEICDLSVLTFFAGQLVDHLKQVALTIPAQMRYSSVFPLLAERFLASGHHMCPEERQLTGKLATQLAHESIKLIVNALCTELEGNWRRAYHQLTSRQPDQQADKTVRPSAKSAARGGRDGKGRAGQSRAGPANDEQDGQDSGVPRPPVRRPPGGVFSDDEKLFMKITELCHSLMRCQQVEVWGYEFLPMQTFIEHIQLRFIRFISDLVDFNAQTGSITKPSVVMSNLVEILTTFQTIESCLNVNITQMMIHVLPQLGAVQPALQVNRETPIVQYMRWYLEIMLARSFDGRILHSPIRECFVTVVAQDDGMTGRAEELTDPVELQALAELVGPFGVRLLNERTSIFIEDFLKKILNKTRESRDVLKSIRAEFTEPQRMMSLAGSLGHVNEIVRLFTSIGICLEFRQLCQQALSQVLGLRSPFLIDFMGQFRSGLDEEKLRDRLAADRAQINGVLASAGQPVDNFDAFLYPIVRHLAETQGPVDAYELFSLSLVYLAVSLPRAAGHDRSHYLVQLGCQANNLHCAGKAFNSLVPVMFAVTPAGPGGGQGGSQEAEARAQEFVALLSTCLLSLGIGPDRPGHHDHRPDKEPVGRNRDSVWLLIESIVDGSPFITMDMFENCFPFALVRGSFRQIMAGGKAVHSVLA